MIDATTYTNTRSRSGSLVLDLKIGSYSLKLGKDVPSPYKEVKTVSIVIAHSPEHQNKAFALRKNMIHDLQTIFPDAQRFIQLLQLEGDEYDMQKKLLSNSLIKKGWNDNGNFTFLVTPGAWETGRINELRAATGLIIPQFYCLPGHPSLFNMPAEGSATYGGITGVYSDPVSARTQLTGLRALLGGVSTLGMLFESQSSSDYMQAFLRGMRSELKNVCDEDNIALVMHTWSRAGYNEGTLRELLGVVDAMMLLPESATEAHRNNIIELCEELHTPLCAHELDSVAMGAILGSGIATTYYSAPLVSLMARAILGNKSAHNLPAVKISEQIGMRYNPYSFKSQGIEMTAEKRALLEMQSVYAECPVAY